MIVLLVVLLPSPSYAQGDTLSALANAQMRRATGAFNPPPAPTLPAPPNRELQLFDGPVLTAVYGRKHHMQAELSFNGMTYRLAKRGRLPNGMRVLLIGTYSVVLSDGGKRLHLPLSMGPNSLSGGNR